MQPIQMKPLSYGIYSISVTLMLEFLVMITAIVFQIIWESNTKRTRKIYIQYYWQNKMLH